MITPLLLIIIIIASLSIGYLIGIFCKFRSLDDYNNQLQEGIFYRDSEIKDLEKQLKGENK